MSTDVRPTVLVYKADVRVVCKTLAETGKVVFSTVLTQIAVEPTGIPSERTHLLSTQQWEHRTKIVLSCRTIVDERPDMSDSVVRQDKTPSTTTVPRATDDTVTDRSRRTGP